MTKRTHHPYRANLVDRSQQALARDRLGIETDILPGGHLIALSQPAKLASYLLSA